MPCFRMDIMLPSTYGDHNEICNDIFVGFYLGCCDYFGRHHLV